MFLSGAWDAPLPPELITAERARPAWRDELVSLHVLAEHGDEQAAATAQRWMATDPQARAVWEGVDSLRSQLTGPSGASPTQ